MQITTAPLAANILCLSKSNDIIIKNKIITIILIIIIIIIIIITITQLFPAIVFEQFEQQVPRKHVESMGICCCCQSLVGKYTNNLKH